MDREEYEASKVKYDGLVNIYRTPPDDSNLMHDFQCMTITLRNNEDTRNYLLTGANFELKQIPRTEEHNLENFELWKENVHPHKAFYFFDLLFGETTAIESGDVFELIERDLPQLRNHGYVFLRNSMGREWDDYEKYEAEMEKEFQLSKVEVEDRSIKFRKAAAGIAYALKKERIERSKGILKLLLSIIFWIEKKTVYKGMDLEG